MSEAELVFGLHAVEAVLARAPERIVELLLSRDRKDRRLAALRDRAESQGLRIRDASRDELARHAGEGVHQGVIARLRPRPPLSEDGLIRELLPALPGPALLLVLDGVTDPHNLGACLRSAEAFGAQALVVPRDNSAPLNATARKAASGAADVVPLVVVTNLARSLRALQEAGVWIVGAAGEAATPIDRVDLGGPVALVLGAEGAGLRRLTREHCDYLAAIPMAGSVGSLNVSVAAGVFLYEAARQRDSVRR
ncbi:MAG: 23S rRNA (guanosine(2251)-2'-O)-methyltransferase RlmB [Gammaproteobacteria bacterium]